MILGVLAASLAACGYRLAGQSTKLPDPVRTIAIPVFANDTAEPDLELTVTRAVTEKFQHDGRLAVVPSAGADSVLTATITGYTLEPMAYDAENKATQYRVRLKVKIKFEDKVGQGVAIERAVNAQWDYKLGASITQAETARQDAIIEAARYLGDRLIGLLLEGF
ncbi:MAG: hypothetical protein HZA04_09235 [Nitrospinae bacterium]|nr:hypothetical protein [Nitrospinota bacterium]